MAENYTPLDVPVLGGSGSSSISEASSTPSAPSSPQAPFSQKTSRGLSKRASIGILAAVMALAVGVFAVREMQQGPASAQITEDICPPGYTVTTTTSGTCGSTIGTFSTTGSTGTSDTQDTEDSMSSTADSFPAGEVGDGSGDIYCCVRITTPSNELEPSKTTDQVTPEDPTGEPNDQTPTPCIKVAGPELLGIEITCPTCE